MARKSTRISARSRAKGASAADPKSDASEDTEDDNATKKTTRRKVIPIRRSARKVAMASAPAAATPVAPDSPVSPVAPVSPAPHSESEVEKSKPTVGGKGILTAEMVAIMMAGRRVTPKKAEKKPPMKESTFFYTMKPHAFVALSAKGDFEGARFHLAGDKPCRLPKHLPKITLTVPVGLNVLIPKVLDVNGGTIE